MTEFLHLACCPHFLLGFLVFDIISSVHLYSLRNDIDTMPESQDGCSSQSETTSVTRDIVACVGVWEGHVQNANHLCSSGFEVCSWQHKSLLRQIHWSTATVIEGCYAYNAAQDGNRCMACRSDVNSDDMAGVGRDCPHRNFGQTSCLLEGRIDSSCCVDSISGQACHYKTNITSGVLCCRHENPISNHLPKKESVAILAPATQMVRSVGESASVLCPLVDMFDNNVEMLWTKDGHLLPHITKVRFDIPYSKVSDSGLYACRRRRDGSIGIGHVNLTVTTVVNIGCADGTSEGFHDAHDVQGCEGSWTGHIKRARHLCASGWRICNVRDKPFLDLIDQVYFKEFGGCFAYNAAVIRNKCRRCKGNANMAALGGECPINERLSKTLKKEESCYSAKVITAYPAKLANHMKLGCNYRPHTGISGVLCCKKGSNHRGRQNIQGEGFSFSELSDRLECYPPCRNGGSCLSGGRCLCPTGYFGSACQHGGCLQRCLNGGRCYYGFCKCFPPFSGSHCQNSPVVDLHKTKEERDTVQ